MAAHHGQILTDHGAAKRSITSAPGCAPRPREAARGLAAPSSSGVKFRQVRCQVSSRIVKLCQGLSRLSLTAALSHFKDLGPPQVDKRASAKISCRVTAVGSSGSRLGDLRFMTTPSSAIREDIVALAMPEHGEDTKRIPDRRPTALTRAARPGGDGAARPLDRRRFGGRPERRAAAPTAEGESWQFGSRRRSLVPITPARTMRRQKSRRFVGLVRLDRERQGRERRTSPPSPAASPSRCTRHCRRHDGSRHRAT